LINSPNTFLRVSLSLEYFYDLPEVERFRRLDYCPDDLTLLGSVPQNGLMGEISAWLVAGPRVFEARFGADEAFFYPPDPDHPWGRPLCERNLNEWIEATCRWAEGSFGQEGRAAYFRPPRRGRLPSIQLWLSEAAFFKAHLPKKLHFWPILIDRYGKALEGLGLGSPRQNARPKPHYEHIKEYYRVANAKELPRPSFEREFNEKIRPMIIPPKSFSDEALAQCFQRNLSLAMENGRSFFEDLEFTRKVLEFESERLKNFLCQRKENNAVSLKAVERFGELAEPYMGIKPSAILSRAFGASRLPWDSAPLEGYQGKIVEDTVYLLPSGDAYETSFYGWRDLSRGESGHGAISLYQRLGGVSAEEATIWLLTAFPYAEVKKSLAYHEALPDPVRVAEVKMAPFSPPPAVEETWPEARDYLLSELKLPEWVVDEAHADRRVYSNARGSIVFRREGDSGLFLTIRQKSQSGLPRVISLWPESAPFILKGTDSPAYLVDHPIEALALKAFFPASPVLAVGDKPALAAVAPYLAGQEAVVAALPTSTARRLASRLKGLKLRLFKTQEGKNWLGLWLMAQEARGLASKH
jgi:hypothetical protein